MDLPEDSNVTDKSWDHPWTTEEMRQCSEDWSLAADAGLLKHLRQFSDNLTERVQKTREKLNSLSGELEEASVIIDNVTNASLALANTQFIESRVYEDDVDIDRSRDTENSKANEEDHYEDDLIACVSESIKQGLSIMDEKFQRLEVLASDSEDEGEAPTPSVVLKPKDPYQNRPLPYVIGTEKWKASSKVGLESSSSDSEPPDGDEDSASENKNEIRHSTEIENNRRVSLLLGSSSLSSSSSELSDRNEGNSAVKDYSSFSSRTDKLEARSQDTLNSGSEIATPGVVKPRTENSSKGAAPSFAEELAKRLGNVLPGKTILNPVKDSQEADQSSINRFKDDLFASDVNDVFDTKSENLFGDGNNLFDDDASNSLWKDKPYRAPITNIIPPSLDVPPPMHAEVTKQKSAFDDLCGDPESEDSDNIFASKSTAKIISPRSTSASDDKRDSSNSRENKFLNVAHGENTANMATSTPETNDNGGLFGDENDYDGDDVLFGESVKSRNRTTERSPELSRATSRTTPQGPSITQADILSSNLGSRLFQRVPRQGSSDSSDIESSSQHPDPRGNERIVTESDSSGISLRPNSNTINNTTNNTFGLGVDFQPQLESTRLKSEEIYRERFPSDSLFDGRTRQPELTNSIENSSPGPHEAGIIAETFDSARDEDFDGDDVFGPPPLPKHNDSKSKLEFTSNDDLFSNSSSESRSRKSFDLLAAGESQYDVKITSDRSGGLFDEDVDIFGNGDAPQIDIFGDAFKSSNISALESGDRANSKISYVSSIAPTEKKQSSDSFVEKIIENRKSSLSTGETVKSVVKGTSIFDDSEDENDSDDLFGENFLKNQRKYGKTMLESEDNEIFPIKASTTVTTELNETKKDFSRLLLARENVTNETTTKRRVVKLDSDEPSIDRALPSCSSSSGLFDNLEDKYVDDSLFAGNVSVETRTSDGAKKKLSDDSVTSEKTSNKELEFRKNCPIIDESSKKRNIDNSVEKKSDTVETASNESEMKKMLETLSLKKDDSSSVLLLNDESDVTSTDGGKISKIRDTTDIIGEITRKDPPKTLSIRLPNASDETSQLPRRAVSGKIKNLMGKMGDLKILSPTDTPPLWRKNDENTDIVYERTESRDSEDGSLMSVPGTKSPTIISTKNDDNDDIFSETTKEPAPSSPLDDSGNSEIAVSFDLPAQIEVLAVTASKSRARIQAKRRPQSRHARQSALRKSGIDFDTVDNSGIEAVESDPRENTLSIISDKIITVVSDRIVVESTITDDRLVGIDIEAGKFTIDKTAETGSSLAPEDRSEMSFSKGSSLSLNKNTLLSPSTDEEDLFDVPPDLPEDPPKEDTLFGRAPILSPIDRSLVGKNIRSRERSKVKESKYHDNREITKVRDGEKSIRDESMSEKILENASIMEKLTDPLRDNSHDPLKDPSQLFAFVTKTPSPEKGQNVLFKEDASLFTHLAKKSAQEARSAMKKPISDLFADDETGGDLFSETIAKSTKKSVRSAVNNSLFDDVKNIEEDCTSDLFDSRVKIPREKKNEKMEETITSKSRENLGRASPSRGTIFSDDDDDLLFVDAMEKKLSPETEKPVVDDDDDDDDTETKIFSSTGKITKDTGTRSRDIFGDHSSGEEDLFSKSKIIGTGRVIGASGSIFDADDDDDDADDIFGNKASSKSTRAGTIENRSSVKKSLTRDLKKTAETIVQDPLSMLQDD